jgi:hypothetical protein
VLGEAKKVHSSSGVLDTDKHVDPLAQDGVDMQEVDCENAVSLGGKELSPAWSGSSRCGRQAGLAQDGAHGCGGEAMAKSEQLPGDALIAPAGILAGQPQHGLTKVRRDRWAAG